MVDSVLCWTFVAIFSGYWITGESARCHKAGADIAVTFNCPTPLDNSNNAFCCGPTDNQYCCAQQSDDGQVYKRGYSENLRPVSYIGNGGMPTSPSPPVGEQSMSVPLLAGVAGGLAVLICITCCFCPSCMCYKARKRRGWVDQADDDPMHQTAVPPLMPPMPAFPNAFTTSQPSIPVTTQSLPVPQPSYANTQSHMSNLQYPASPMPYTVTSASMVPAMPKSYEVQMNPAGVFPANPEPNPYGRRSPYPNAPTPYGHRNSIQVPDISNQYGSRSPYLGKDPNSAYGRRSPYVQYGGQSAFNPYYQQ